jgi:monoamine oxidase
MWTLDGRRDPIPWERLVERLRPASRDFVRAKRSWTSAAARRLARTPVETWMRRERLPHDERAHWRGLVRGLLLGDPRRLSLLQLVSELTGGEEAGPTGDFFRIRGGNDLLPAAIARELASPVVLRAVAHRVRQGPRAVRVEADVDGRPATFDADAAVIALPVPPLRRLAFSPSLPARQRRAIATVGFGPVVKTALRLRSLPAPRGFAFGSDLDVGAFWDASEGVRGSPALVSVTTAGDHAARVSARTERARVAWVANRLPLASPRDVLEGRSVAWEREPFAGGGYAVFDAGFDPRLRAELARPFRRLAFAGEHTSDAFQGYVNGAIESGLRAAAEALRLRG